MQGHTKYILGTQLLPDGRILSWSFDKTLRLWDGQSGAALVVLQGHTEHVKGAQLLPDGRILSWSLDKTLRLWDGQSGIALDQMPDHWVETGNFPGCWEKYADGKVAFCRGAWWVQNINEQRISIAEPINGDKARWQGNGSTKLTHVGAGLICAVVDRELVFLEIWRGAQSLLLES